MPVIYFVGAAFHVSVALLYFHVEIFIACLRPVE
jgi:hypothetical protein